MNEPSDQSEGTPTSGYRAPFDLYEIETIDTDALEQYYSARYKWS